MRPRALGDVPGLTIVESGAAALQSADAPAIATEWKEFRTPDFEAIRAPLGTPGVLDGRSAEFASLSWLAPTPEEALSGVRAVVADVVA